jgi:hypothetical protein
MTVNIPVIQMTPEQKKRVNELGTHLSGAIWTRLTRIEKWAVCEGIHGMKLNIDNVFTSFQLSVNRNKENTIDQKKKEEVVLVDTESTSDSDHNETTQRKSKRVRIQSQK